jgi:hypothetical protein
MAIPTTKAPPRKTTIKKSPFLEGFEAIAFPTDLYNPSNPILSKVKDFVVITINRNSKAPISDSSPKELSLTKYNNLTNNTKLTSAALFSYGASETFKKVAKNAGKIADTVTEKSGIDNVITDEMKTSMKEKLASALTSLTPATFKKINQIILLPMPFSVNTNYGMVYSPADANVTFNSVLNVAAQDNLKAAGNNIGNAAVMTTREFLKSSMNSTVGADSGALIDKATGVVANPRTEQVFKSVRTRTFQFSYLFAMRTPKEMADFKKIIKTLKSNMHPEIVGDFWATPNEFDIDFFSIINGETSTNKTVPLITTCLLTDLEVDYSPNGMYTSMVDGGVPWVGLKLGFTEAQPLHRAAIEAGY